MTFNLDNIQITLSVQDGNFVATMNQGNKAVNLFTVNANNLANALNGNVAPALKTVSAQLTGFVNGFNVAQLAAEKFGSKAAGLFDSALESFREFEIGVARVSKVIEQLGSGNLNEFKKTILDLSTTIPLSSHALLDIAQNLGSLGFFAKNTSADVNEAIKSTVELVAKFSVASGLSGEEAAKSLGTLRNIFLGTETDARRVTKALQGFADASTAVANTTAATEGFLVQFDERVGATASTLGLTFNEVTGLGGAIAQLGISAGVGGTVIQNVLNRLSTETDKFAAAINVSSVSLKSLLKQSPNEALLLFFSKLNALTAQQRVAAISAIDADSRFLTVVQGLANNIGLITSAQETANKGAREGTAVNEAAARQFNTLNTAIVEFNNTVHKALIEGFAPFAAAIGSVLTGVNALAKDFPVASAAISTLATGVGGALAAMIGLGLVIGPISKSVSALSGVFKGFSAILGTEVVIGAEGATAAITGLGAAFSNLRKIAGTTALIALLAVIAEGITTFLDFKAKVEETNRELGKLQKAGNLEALQQQAGKAADEIEKANTGIGAFFVSLFKNNQGKSRITEEIDSLREFQASIKKTQQGYKDLLDTISKRAQPKLADDGKTVVPPKPEDKALEQAKNTVLKANVDAATAFDAVTQLTVGKVKDLISKYKVAGDAVIAIAAVEDKRQGTGKKLVDAALAELDAKKNLADSLALAVSLDQLQNNEKTKQLSLANALGEQAVALNEQNLKGNEAYSSRTRSVLATKDALDLENRQLAAQESVLRDSLLSYGAILETNKNGISVLKDGSKVQSGDLAATKASLQALLEVQDKRKALKDQGAAIAAQQIAAETTYQTALRATRTTIENITLAEKERSTNDAATKAKLALDVTDQKGGSAIEAQRVNALIQINKARQAIALANIDQEEKNDKTVLAGSELYANKRLAVQKETNDKNKALTDEFNNKQLEDQKKNNLELDAIIRSSTGPSVNGKSLDNDQVILTLRAQFEEIKKVNGLNADGNKIREASAIIEARIKQAVQEVKDAQEIANRALIDFNKQVADQTRDQLIKEKALADTKLLGVKQSVNLNQQQGRQALEIAKIENELAKGIAERDADRILSTKEISEIENARIAAAEKESQLSGQSRTAQGRKDLADTVERIHLEAQQDRDRSTSFENLTEKQINDNRDSKLKQNSDDLKLHKISIEEKKQLDQAANTLANNQKDTLSAKDATDPEKQRVKLEQDLNDAKKHTKQVEDEEKTVQEQINKLVEDRAKKEQEINNTLKERGDIQNVAKDAQTQGTPENATAQAPTSAPTLPVNNTIVDQAKRINELAPASTNSSTLSDTAVQAATKIGDNLSTVETAVQSLNSAFSVGVSGIINAATKVSGAADELTGNLKNFSDKIVDSLGTVTDSIVSLNYQVSYMSEIVSELSSTVASI